MHTCVCVCVGRIELSRQRHTKKEALRDPTCFALGNFRTDALWNRGKWQFGSRMQIQMEARAPERAHCVWLAE
jgi:hypothetical protein